MIAFVLGLAIAACRVSPVPPLRWVGGAYVELVRNCPLAVLFVLFWFGLPEAGVSFPRFPSAVAVLSLYTGAFVAEAVRAGIGTVSRGQVEAARAIGLTFPSTLRIVVLPQALRTVVGPLGSLFSALIRNSSVAYTISVFELLSVTYRVGNESAQFFVPFLAGAVGYLILTIPTGLAVGVLERRVAVRR